MLLRRNEAPARRPVYVPPHPHPADPAAPARHDEQAENEDSDGPPDLIPLSSGEDSEPDETPPQPARAPTVVWPDLQARPPLLAEYLQHVHDAAREVGVAAEMADALVATLSKREEVAEDKE